MTHSKHLLSVNMLTFHFNKIYGSEGSEKNPHGLFPDRGDLCFSIGSLMTSLLENDLQTGYFHKKRYGKN